MDMIAYCDCETPVFDPEHDAGCRRCGLPIDFSPKPDSDNLHYFPSGFTAIPKMPLVPGSTFNTAHETDCICKTRPDDLGNFLAWDSDNVLCAYNVAMVTRVGEIVAEVENHE